MEIGSFNKKNNDSGEEFFINANDKEKLMVTNLPVHANKVNYSCRASNNFGEMVEKYQILYADGNESLTTFSLLYIKVQYNLTCFQLSVIPFETYYWILGLAVTFIFVLSICCTIYFKIRADKVWRNKCLA